MQNPRVAILDIGTNSVHLFVTNQDAHGDLEYVYTKKFPLRLGEDLAKGPEISKTSTNLLCKAVAECINLAKTHRAPLKCFATYSLRTANNASDVIDQVRKKTGISIQVLSGLEEAKAIFIGQQAHFDLDSRPWMMMDIGGGSTEVIFGQGNRAKKGPLYHSLNLGAVTASMKYGFLNNKHRGVQVLAAKIQKVCRKTNLPEKSAPVCCYGSSGTIKAIGKLHRHLFKQTEALHGHTISLNQLWELQNVLMNWNTPGEIAENTGLSVRRSEVIWAGMTILLGVMHFSRCEKLVISKASIRDGLAIKEITDKAV